MPLPQQPARVKVTLADGTVGWLADPPEERSGAARRSGGGSSTTGATPGVWPWPRVLELERSARQPWRWQYATVERVNPGPPAPGVWRADLGDRAGRSPAGAASRTRTGSRGCRSGTPVRCSGSTTIGIRFCCRRSSRPA